MTDAFLFIPPRLPEENSLDANNFDGLVDDRVWSERVPSYPAKSLERIISIMEGKVDETVHIFEWLAIVENPDLWEGVDEERALNAFAKGLIREPVLSDILFFKIALALDEKPTRLAPPLVRLPLKRLESEQIDSLTKGRFQWVRHLCNADYHSMSVSLYESATTPSSYIEWLKLPRSNSYSSRLVEGMLGCVSPRQMTQTDDAWLANYFTELTALADRVRFFEALISRLHEGQLGEKCDQLVVVNCLPVASHSLWSNLSVASQSLLKASYPISFYFSLDTVVAALIGDTGERNKEFSSDTSDQIRQRMAFWSNYSDRYERVRFLLPEDSLAKVSEKLEKLPNFVQSIEPGEEESEVCIFELSLLNRKVIVVELLRGDLAETRFFKATELNERTLFDSTALSVDQITRLSQDNYHDHLYLWQFYCERLLRETYGIYPNDSCMSFVGLNEQVSKYDRDHGLTAPTDEEYQKRLELLAPWIGAFWEKEVDLLKLGSSLTAKQKLLAVKWRKNTALSEGRTSNFIEIRKQGVEQQVPDVMWMEGVRKLNDPRGSKKSKLEGEKLIIGAAKAGHLQARDFTMNHFDLSPEALQSTSDGEDSSIAETITGPFGSIHLASIPAGVFKMGDLTGNGNENEKPVHTVTVPAFKMMTTAVTWNHYQPCIDAGVCANPRDETWGRDDRPVINVSWNDTQTYIKWLKETTGLSWRLPSEAEWEYAARSGTMGDYPWGSSASPDHANCYESGHGNTVEVAQYPANAFGLHDMHGNFVEWVEDRWHDNYQGAPSDGSAREDGNSKFRVVRGGSWYPNAKFTRLSYRSRGDATVRFSLLGFRLVQGD